MVIKFLNGNIVCNYIAFEFINLLASFQKFQLNVVGAIIFVGQQESYLQVHVRETRERCAQHTCFLTYIMANMLCVTNLRTIKATTYMERDSDGQN